MRRRRRVIPAPGRVLEALPMACDPDFSERIPTRPHEVAPAPRRGQVHQAPPPGVRQAKAPAGRVTAGAAVPLRRRCHEWAALALEFNPRAKSSKSAKAAGKAKHS